MTTVELPAVTESEPGRMTPCAHRWIGSVIVAVEDGGLAQALPDLECRQRDLRTPPQSLPAHTGLRAASWAIWEACPSGCSDGRTNNSHRQPRVRRQRSQSSRLIYGRVKVWTNCGQQADVCEGNSPWRSRSEQAGLLGDGQSDFFAGMRRCTRGPLEWTTGHAPGGAEDGEGELDGGECEVPGGWDLRLKL